MTPTLRNQLKKELLERTVRCTKQTYAKLHVGQVVQAEGDLKYTYQPPGMGPAKKYSVKHGEKMLIMMFTRNRKTTGRFLVYAKSLETGDPMECQVIDVAPCAFIETLHLFRN